VGREQYTMRKIMDGCYDRGHEVAEPTGSGPGFEEAMRKYKARQAKATERGKWRKSDGVDEGTFIDPDWYIVNWGQDDEQ
jgi:hypothetical protein